MLSVVHSDCAAALTAAFIDELPPRSPFAPLPVVVGHPLIATWLERAVAQRSGMSTGLAWLRLDDFVAEAYQPVALALGRHELAWAVARMCQLPDHAARWPAVARYLGPAREPLKRLQFASRLADAYWTYAQARPAWLLAWQAGRMPAEATFTDEAMAIWQGDLYAQTLAALAAWQGRPVVPTPVLPAYAAAQGLTPTLPARFAGQAVRVFGLSHLTQSQLHVLMALAEQHEVVVYLQNPCAEMWDDLTKRAAMEAGQPEPSLLPMWGGPLRETFAALVTASQGDFRDAFLPPARVSLYWALRDDLRARHVPTEPEPLPRDIQVLACPSLRRELEAVAADIWAKLAADASLHATDVGVLLAGRRMPAYMAALPLVFTAAGPAGERLPFHLVDMPVMVAGQIVQALTALLDVPEQGYSRAAMLALVTHPVVMAAFPHAHVDDWLAWADAAGVAFGRDGRDQADTYLAGAELFHWDQGIKRLALGAFAPGPRAGNVLVAIGDQGYMPIEVAADKQASAASFALLVRSVVADLTWLSAMEATPPEWASYLEALVQTYLGASPHERAELASERGRVLAVIRELADGALLPGRIGFAELRAWLATRLAHARRQRGEPLADGVTVAPLGPHQAVPFRHVYVLGLAEADFPAGQAATTFDVRGATRALDVSPRQRDRLAMLLALLALPGGGAATSVTLSYVARDEQTGETLGPSTVLLELADALAPYLGAPSAAACLATLTRALPLYAHDGEHGADDPAVATRVGRERWAVTAYAHVTSHLRACGLEVPAPSELASCLEVAQPALAAALSSQRLGPLPQRPTPSARQVSLAQLRNFIVSPVQAWAKTVLELREDDDDGDEARSTSHEPFSQDSLTSAQLRRQVMQQYLAGGGASLPELYDQAYSARRQQSQAPYGLFAEAVRASDLAMLECWVTALGEGAVGPVRRVAFGKAYADATELLRPLSFELHHAGRPVEVTLVGCTELLTAARGSLSLVKKPYPETWLRGMLDHVVLSLLVPGHAAHHATMLSVEGLHTVALPAWEASAAQAYLASLLGALLFEPHAYLAPLDWLLTGRVNNGPSDTDPMLGFGPVTSRLGLRQLSSDDRTRLYDARLAPLLAHAATNPFVPSPSTRKRSRGA